MEAITEVMTGRVDFACMGRAVRDPSHQRLSRLVALAVCTPKRSTSLPDVPTTIEAGYPDSDYNYWMGLFVPAKTDRAIVERLRRGNPVAALAEPALIEKFKPQGIEPMPLSPEEFDALIKKEVVANVALKQAKAAGIKIN